MPGKRMKDLHRWALVWPDGMPESRMHMTRSDARKHRRLLPADLGIRIAKVRISEIPATRRRRRDEDPR